MIILAADAFACWAMHLGISILLNEDVDGLLLIADFDPVHMIRCMQIEEVLEQLLYFHPAKLINPPFWD